MNSRGADIQSALDEFELATTRRRLGPVLLGIALAAGAVAGGLLAFLLVFVVLVGLIR